MLLRIAALLAAVSFCAAPCWAAGELELRAVDTATGEPVAVRVHLKNLRGTMPRIPGLPVWNDHFVFSGKCVLKLPNGRYTFEAERGPEYKLRTGHFIIENGAADNHQLDMVRFVDMKREGWWSGDLHLHRPAKDLELLMLAEDLHVAPLVTWGSDKSATPLPAGKSPLVQFGGDKFYHLQAGEDDRDGGTLLYFNLERPLEFAAASREFPSSAQFLLAAKAAPGAHVDAEKPYWWDLPLWVALGKLDSVGVCHGNLGRQQAVMNEAHGRPRDKLAFPDPHGNGKYAEAVYYHLLNCGLRIAPSAGSGSGVTPNPVGYNRVYVHCGEELTWEKWWNGLKAGRVVITNGPLLRPTVNGEYPGFIFRGYENQPLELTIAANLATREPIDYFEIVQNGKVVEQVRLDKWAAMGGELPPLRFTDSGWLLVRAVTSNPKTYRYAASGPFYVDFGRPRISRRSAQFFLDWVDERIARIKLTDPAQRSSVLAFQQQAREYWAKMVAQANAE